MTDVLRPTMITDGTSRRAGESRSLAVQQVASLVVADTQFSPGRMLAKRLIDIVVATTALLLALPISLLIATIVAATSRGPVFFRQKRVGRNGELFTILKFRTMQDNTHALVQNDPELWKQYVANDYKLPNGHCQITRIGYFLRKLSLDEIPQLINVIRGDMSVVGIRPLVPREFEARPETSRELYCQLAPGITGLWQVEGRSSVRHEERIRLDDTYVESWSLARDLALLARTPLGLLRAHHTS